LPAVLGALRQEVVAPYMVPMRCPMANAPVGTSTRQSPAFPLLSRHLHVLHLPDPMHPLEVHPPPTERIRARQNTMHPVAPVPRERLHDLSHHLEQLAVAVHLPGAVTLRTPVLAEDATDPSFRDLLLPQGPPDGFHRPTATLGAHQFGRAASLRISMSNA
jgi:hypothetical protein